MRSVDPLFEKFQLGKLTLRNRLTMSAVGTELGRDGFVTERMIRYYERRAEGGVGLIHVEFCAFDQSGQTNRNQPRLDDDEFIPAMRRLVERIHRHGAAAVLQLAHAGRQMSQKLSRRQPVAPSAVPCPLVRSEPRELGLAEIEHLMDQFAAAALRARQAGFDGVQFHGAHGYLFHQFVSPTSNLRTDRFGGSCENRLRFPLETMERARRAVGADFLIGYKISAKEYVEGGYEVEDAVRLAQELERLGLDYVEVSAGTYANLDRTVQPMIYPRGVLVPFAAQMKSALSIPVIAVGRINDPEVAADVIRGGSADLIGLGRGLLADPDFPRKAAEGRLEDIRRCVACNECLALAFQLKDVGCLINPEVGREGTIPMGRTLSARRVLVVGSGPAGLQAAITASQKGHHVILCEREASIGGKLPIVGAPPGKEEYNVYYQYLLTQLHKTNVEIRLNTEVTAGLVEELAPTDIFLATGARPVTPSISGVDLPHVFQAEEALRREVPGRRTVVLGASGTGCETAQFLHEAGKEVTVIARSGKAARSIEPITRRLVLEEMRKAGIRMMFGLECVKIAEGHVQCADAEGNEIAIECDSVILARGYESDRALERELPDGPYRVQVLGDAVDPRQILHAVADAVLAASAL